MNHLVILHTPYLAMILAGVKTVESRLSLRRHPAAAHLARGDRLYLKQAGGDVRAVATAGTITEFQHIPAGGIGRLAEEWAPRVVGGGPDDPYWRAKAHARFALFIELEEVRPCHIPAACLPRRLPWASGWIVGQPDEELVRHSASDCTAGRILLP